MDEIEKLAQFIIQEVPGEPSRSEGAIETAIRVLGEYMDIIAKLASTTFEEAGEGGGHDLGLWLDSGELTEGQHLTIKQLLWMY